MKSSNYFFIAVFCGLLLANSFAGAQGIGINSSGNAADPSAILDASSTNKGALLPRLNTAQRNAIASPALGLMIFNTDCNSLNLYNGSSWMAIGNNSGIATPAGISGNTTPCINATGIPYSIATVPNATGYNWTVTSGATITSGQGTTDIVVNFGSTSGNICVNATDACGYSSPSCLSFSILNTPPAPVATGAGTFTKTSFTANWNTSSTATAYYLDVATDASFTNIVSGYNNLNAGNVTSTSVSGLLCSTTYYYRVRAANSCGTSANSNTISASTLDCCSNEWTAKAGFNSARYAMVGFSIGTKGYMGTGINSSGYATNDFWEWDQSTNVWTQKASYGGGARYNAFSFVIGAKGYVGTGINSSGYATNDVYEFDPVANSWTAKASYSAGARYSSFAFVIGSLGYVGTGINSSGYATNDFYEFDPIANTWTSKPAYGGGARYKAVAFTIGTKGYVGTGINSSGYATNDFWEWDGSSWISKASFSGGAKYGAVGFALGSKGYIGTGVNSSGYATNDFWEWDPVSNSWTSKISYAGGSVYNAASFSIGNKGYVGTGINSSGYAIATFYEFCP